MIISISKDLALNTDDIISIHEQPRANDFVSEYPFLSITMRNGTTWRVNDRRMKDVIGQIQGLSKP